MLAELWKDKKPPVDTIINFIDNRKVMLPVIIAVIFCLAVVAVLSVVGGRKSSGGGSGGAGRRTRGNFQKNRAQIIRDCTKKLSHDPYNTQALLPLADLYFSENLWDKAVTLYGTLVDLAATHSDVDPALVTLRHGICCVKLKRIPEAIKSLVTAYKLQSDTFDVNYYLGQACFANNDFEKAIPCFKKAYTINPEAGGISEPLGMAMYKAKKYRDCLPVLRKALNDDPQNKECLFAMADAMQECGAGDKALKVFVHLRPDPVYGPRSCLSAGIIHARMGQNEAAAQDYEIGLKLKDIPTETFLELNYRLAQCYFSTNKIAQGLACLTTINNTVPNYKDVSTLISRYKELNQNTNLQLYLTSGTSDFVVLCRNLVSKFYPRSFVKISDVEVQQESVEILCEVETPKWEDVELFRFFRATGAVGELFVRDFHAKLKDKKVDRGFCVTPGAFSEEAHKYVEGRPIDLIEKAQLMQLLKKITLK